MIDGSRTVFWIDGGTLWWRWNHQTQEAPAKFLMQVYDHPERIVVGKAITADQRLFMYTLYTYMGVRYMAKDINNLVGFFSERPEKGMAFWYLHGKEGHSPGSKVWFEGFTTDLVSWYDEEPFSLEEALFLPGFDDEV